MDCWKASENSGGSEVLMDYWTVSEGSEALTGFWKASERSEVLMGFWKASERSGGSEAQMG
jgi:hypothetical protein